MKKILSSLFAIIVFLVFGPAVSGVEAAYLRFDSTSSSAANGATFQIGVVLEPGSDGINSTDVFVTYDSTLLQATTVTAGSLFPTVSNDISTSGTVYIAGLVNDPANSVTSAGTVATITFKGLKEGTGTLSFNCDSSKIVKNDLNATNVISCSQNGTSAVTIGSGSGSDSSATPTPTTSSSSGDTSGSTGSSTTELPRSGIFDNMVKLAVPGTILLFLGLGLRLVL